MSDRSKRIVELPPEQQAIVDKCFHPSGKFEEFPKEDVEKSIPERFEKIVCKFPDRLAVKHEDCSLTYDRLNPAANRIATAILKDYGDEKRPVGVLLAKGAKLMVTLIASTVRYHEHRVHHPPRSALG